MNSLNFNSYPFLDSLYIEFKSTTEYIHSIRKVNEKESNRVEPYEPSMFVFSYFTFNSLYNIYWNSTLANGCRRSFRNTERVETDRINDYLEFIWSHNHQKDITHVFNRTITYVICQYLAEKGADSDKTNILEWIQNNMLEFVLSSKDIDEKGCKISYKKETEFKKKDIVNFIEYVTKSFKEGKLDISEIKQIIQIIYLVRCNLFHGAKDPEFFEQRKQMERFVIYSAILTAINQLLFKTIHRKLSSCVR